MVGKNGVMQSMAKVDVIEPVTVFLKTVTPASRIHGGLQFQVQNGQFNNSI
jgi:hypothetical protein